MRLFALIALLSFGCATAQMPPLKTPIIESVRRPEEQPLPSSPREEKLAGAYADAPEWVEPAEKGETLAKAGMLVSEGRMARDILFRTRYDELRKIAEADRKVWALQREYYEERLVLADQTIRSLQPTWWDEHQGPIYFTGGLILGFGVTVGLVEAVSAIAR